MNYDCLIVGGGVIGLSVAYQLARDGMRVALLDRGRLGREASWAGAGILPPVNPQTAQDPMDRLRALSQPIHEKWSRWLFDETGIDTGYWNCGATYIGRTAGEVSAIDGIKLQWSEEKINYRELSPSELCERVPALENRVDSIRRAVFVPGESQLDNRAHLRALIRACQQRQVDLYEEVEVEDFVIAGERLSAVRTSGGPFNAPHFCIACGSWTALFLKRLDIQISMLPVRGQMLAFKLDRPAFETIVNDSSRYLVPRKDGWVLVGSTLEHAGFSKQTTAAGLRGLYEFAHGLVPRLDAHSLKQRWAGLRPATFDGFPYIGHIPNLPNVLVATGHFRSGLHTSTGTAEIIRDLIGGREPAVEIDPFRIGRG